MNEKDTRKNEQKYYDSKIQEHLEIVPNYYGSMSISDLCPKSEVGTICDCDVLAKAEQRQRAVRARHARAHKIGRDRNREEQCARACG